MAERCFVPEIETWEVEMVIIPHFLFGQENWVSLDDRLIVHCFLKKNYKQGVMVTLKEDGIQTEITFTPLNKFVGNNRFFVLFPELDETLSISWNFMIGEMDIVQNELSSITNLVERQ